MARPSRLRQRLTELRDQIPELVELALQRDPLWRGVVYEAKRKCGKPGCRCARGELHRSWTLGDRSATRQARTFTLQGDDLEPFRHMTERYRQVRSARARLVKITEEMLAIFDELEALRREQAVKRYGHKLPPRRRKPSSS